MVILATVTLALSAGIDQAMPGAQTPPFRPMLVASSSAVATPVISVPTPIFSPGPTPPAQSTWIDLRLPAPAPAAAGLTAKAHLTSAGGAIAGALLRWQLDGGEVATSTTGSGGDATLNLARDLSSGPHTVGVVFAGDPARQLEASSAQGSMVVVSPVGTSVGIRLPNGRRAGQEISVEVAIYHDGQPLPGANVHLAVAGYQAELQSDARGSVLYRLPRTLTAGTHPVGVDYHGDQKRGLLGSAVSGNLVVLPPLPTAVSLALPPPTRTGDAAEVSGKLSSADSPLGSGKPLHVFIDEKKVATLETDGNGSVQFKLPRHLSIGSHAVALEYHGDRPQGIAASSARGSLTITPLAVRLQTLPALPGVTFTVDGSTYVTGPSGSVAVGLQTVGTHRLAVRAPDDRPDAHVQFAHWSDEQRDTDRSLRIFSDRTLYAAFTGSFLTPLSFGDAGGRPLDSSRLGPVRLLGPSGRQIDVEPRQAAVWLDIPAPSRVTLLGLSSRLPYSVESAQFDGVNVANRGDDVFSPGPGRRWNIKLRVYSLRVQVRRPLLGTGIETLVVTSPSGARRLIHADPRGVATLTGLPRGLYSVAAMSGSASPSSKVQMTRDQVLYLSSFTSQELAAAGGVLLFLLLALGTCAAVVHRPALVGRWRR